MTDERWSTVWELFNSAHEMPAEQRSALLASNCIEPDVRSEVLALLEVSSSCTLHRSAPASQFASPEYPAGFEFGRYRIIGLIGQGGFGRIYAAHDQDLRRVVALKVLASALLGDRERLVEEARAASALNHPSIVTVYETISGEDCLAIVMEFVDGRSLRQILKDAPGPLPGEKVIRYGRQMAEALEAAHAAGITHRDVKPENILVRKDEYVKLVDFGLATNMVVTSPDTAARPLAGTLRYFSPEQLRGHPASPASDMFSLGLVFYEMATGVHAFGGESPLDTADAIATAQLVPASRKAPQIPPELDRVLAAMLRKHPSERPTAAEVGQSLAQIAAASGRSAERRWMWVIGATLLTVGGLAVGMSQYVRKPPHLALSLDSRPLTGNEGREIQPALSRNGRYVVYIRHEKINSKPVTLLREIGSDREKILPIPGPFSWLPDNRQIAFVRRGAGRDTLCTIAIEGTAVQEILQTKRILTFEWSPDQKWIAYSAPAGSEGISALFLYSTSSRQTRQITFPPPASLGDEQFAISPDGRQLVYRRTFNFAKSDIFLIAMPGPGPARQVTFHETGGNTVAWTRDGAGIISSVSRGANQSLWLHPLSSPQKPTRLTEVGIEAFDIASAAGRNRLAWVNALEDTNIWSVPAIGGKPIRVIASAMRDLDVASSSLGLLAFRSDRSGFPEIWISGRNGESQKKVTNLESFTGSPRWSPNGRRLAFDSRRTSAATDIYVMNCDPVAMQCDEPVQLTDHAASDAIPRWSADGSHLYFASQRSGQWQVWKIPADGAGRQAVPMTTHGGFFAAEAPGSRWLYYSRIDSERARGVWRKLLPGGSASPFRADDPGEMVLPMEFRATATWSLSGREIFYSAFGDADSSPAVWAFNLQTRQRRIVYDSGDTPLRRGLTLSPDGTTIFFSRLDRWQSNIIVADYEVVK